MTKFYDHLVEIDGIKVHATARTPGELGEVGMRDIQMFYDAVTEKEDQKQQPTK